MDVNGTRFELLLGRRDWAHCEDDDGHELEALWQDTVPGARAEVAWNATRRDLTLRPDALRFEAAPLDRPPGRDDRRGAGRDRFGNWYWITAARTQIVVRSAGSGATTEFWPPARRAPQPARSGAFAAVEAPLPAPPQLLAGAAVTDDHYLAVGTTEPPGLLVFDLQGGGAPSILPWAAEGFAPFDMAARPGGGVFILDGARLWELDRHFAVVGAATELLGDPIAIEPAGDDGVLVLERGDGDGSFVRCYRDGAPTGAPARIADAALGLRVTGHDMALAQGILYVADSGGNQSYAFALELAGGDVALSFVPAYYPMRRFAGKGLVAAAGTVYYDFDDAWIPLADQPRSRYLERAAIVTPVLDAGEPDCVWHRLMLDACLPGGTALRVWSRAADEPDALAVREWQREPDPRPRASGSELPFAAGGSYDTHELLFQHARGRYLRVRIELAGDGRVTPRLRALRAWHPRFSYLARYLPRAYAEDRQSASFLDRFLANVEGLYTAIEDRVGAAQVLLSPGDAPIEALDWLASWFDLALDPLWDERRRRLLLANAMRFFNARGTIRGVELALRLTLEPGIEASAFEAAPPPALRGPRIVEAYRTRRTPGIVFGDPSDAGPRDVTTASRWTPVQGRDALQDGWEAHLAARDLGAVVFPLSDPGGALGETWREFACAALGFVPALPPAARWQAFLARRYISPAALATAWDEPIDDFAAVAPPTRLPADGAPLLDWYQFQSVVLPTEAKAHRFTVLLPWPLHVTDSSGAELDPERLRALASRIVALQQPANTTFAVKFFWAAFRIGEARLGDDTLLGSGSRVPEFVLPAVLGRGHLGEARLAGPVASDVVDRASSIEEIT
jgi:phage tail-like protein